MSTENPFTPSGRISVKDLENLPEIFRELENRPYRNPPKFDIRREIAAIKHRLDALEEEEGKCQE